MAEQHENNQSNNRIRHQLNLSNPVPPNNPLFLNVPNNDNDRQRIVRDVDEESNMFRMGVSQQSISFIEDNKVLFLSGKTQVVDPADENYLTLLKDTFCPNLKLLSLTTLLILVNIIVFIVQLSLGFDSTNSLLQVNYDTLIMMGMNDVHGVYKGQVYRLVVPQFLHLNILHLISNMIILTLLVSRLQYTFGKVKVIIIYIFSGIAGDILSNLLYTDLMARAGSSTSLYGMIGLTIGYLFINWSSLSIIGFIFKFKLILLVVLIFAFLLLFTDVAVSIDFFGHLGGFAGGLLLSGVNPSITNSKRQIAIRIIFLIIFVCYMCAAFLFFYLMPSTNYA